MRKLLGFGGLIVFVLAAALALYLLSLEKLSGAEFVAFVTAFAVIGVVVGFAPEVQEISIVGNVVKLRDVKKSVEIAIQSLTKARTESLRISLNMAVRLPGYSTSLGPVDARSRDFWSIIKLVRECNCLAELKDEALAGTEELFKGQLTLLHPYNEYLNLWQDRDFPEPMELIGNLISKGKIYAHRDNPKIDFATAESNIKAGLNEYTRLWALRVELNSIVFDV